MLDKIRGTIGGWRHTGTGLVERNGKIILLVGGGGFALLALANFGAAITLAVIIAVVTSALGLWKLDP